MILFFAHWGMGHHPFDHLQADGYDIVILYNYTTLNLKQLNTSLNLNQPNTSLAYSELTESGISGSDIYEIIKNYRQINIIALGAGVWAASAAFDNMYHALSISDNSHCGTSNRFRIIRLLKKMGQAIAIDGTLCPVSNIWGIPQQTFNAMLQQQAGATTEQSHAATTELSAFKENYIFSNAIVWTSAIISKNNPIIPAANQTRFWSEYNLCTDRNKKLVFNSSGFSIHYIEKSHFPFQEYEKWDSILNYNKTL